MSFDVSGLNELVADLTAAPRRVQVKTAAVVLKGAVNVQKDWRQRASGLAHAPAYPASVTYEAGWKGSAFEAQVGPDKGLPQGALGNLIEFGSVNSPPHGDGSAAMDTEAPKFEKAMGDLADEAL